MKRNRQLAARQRRRELKIYRKRRKRKAHIKAKNFLANIKKDKSAKQKRKSFIRPPVPKVLMLPENFSFIHNPNEVLRIFAKFMEYANNQVPIIFDFEKVRNITPDVIPLLLAKVYKYSRSTRIAGTRPRIKELDDLLLESGFYKMVGLTNYKSDRGILDTHRNKVVNREVAVEARKLTANKTFGNPELQIRPLYRTLIECMANTRKHAAKEETRREHWWLSVYYEPTSRKTSFSFCDTGIGIFKSTKLNLH